MIRKMLTAIAGRSQGKGACEGDQFTLVFLHLPKTAGLSLRETLLAETAQRPRFRIIHPIDDLAALARLPVEQRSGLALIEGHLYYGVHECIGRECRYMTMLRDPVERVLSWYSFVREYVPHHLHERLAGSAGGAGMSLADCLRDGVSVELDNHMVRMLAGQKYVNVPFGQVTGAMLAEAREHLAGFAAVGIRERFDDSLRLFASVFGWRQPRPHHINITGSRLHRDQLEPETLAAVRAQNELDAELYRYAVSLFERQMSRLDTKG
jgi:hypothetical protein